MTQTQTTLPKYVRWVPARGKYRAEVYKSGHKNHLGYYDTASEASDAVDKFLDQPAFKTSGTNTSRTQATTPNVSQPPQTVDPVAQLQHAISCGLPSDVPPPIVGPTNLLPRFRPFEPEKKLEKAGTVLLSLSTGSVFTLREDVAFSNAGYESYIKVQEHSNPVHVAAWRNFVVPQDGIDLNDWCLVDNYPTRREQLTQLSLDTAVNLVLDSFVVARESFSAYQVTKYVREQVNSGRWYIVGVPYTVQVGPNNFSKIRTQFIDHNEVRGLVAGTMATVIDDIEYEAKYGQGDAISSYMTYHPKPQELAVVVDDANRLSDIEAELLRAFGDDDEWVESVTIDEVDGELKDEITKLYLGDADPKVEITPLPAPVVTPPTPAPIYSNTPKPGLFKRIWKTLTGN